VTTSLPSAYTNRTINLITTNTNGLWLGQCDHINQLTALSVITLSDFPFNFLKADVRLCQFNKIITFYLIDHIKHVSLYIEDLWLNLCFFFQSLLLINDHSRDVSGPDPHNVPIEDGMRSTGSNKLTCFTSVDSFFLFNLKAIVFRFE
jgi:hypothetical protein